MTFTIKVSTDFEKHYIEDIDLLEIAELLYLDAKEKYPYANSVQILQIEPEKSARDITSLLHPIL